jgi:mono/diheme cytochrome c family protein
MLPSFLPSTAHDLRRLLLAFSLFVVAAGVLVGCGSEEKPDLQTGDDLSSSAKRSMTPEELYVTHCARCHLPSGKGVDGQYPPLAGSRIVDAPKSWIVRIVMHGLEGPIRIRGTTYDDAMPNQWHLADSTIARIATFVRDRFGNGASAVSAEEVTQVRRTYRGRQSAWTIEELRADSLVLRAPAEAQAGTASSR